MSVIVTVYPDSTAYVGIDHVKSALRNEDEEFLSAQVYVALEGSTTVAPVDIKAYHSHRDLEEDYETVLRGLFFKGASEPEVAFSMTYDLRG
jgi:hypothetical protein